MQLGWEAFEKKHPLPEHVRNAVSSLLACRTALLGGHIQGCPDGHFTRHWYNSCKHRICPQCAYIQIERWLVKQKNRLLDCDHYHVIFTIPHQLNDIYLVNVHKFTNLFFQSVKDTLFDFLQDPKHMGGTPGIIASLHSWNQLLRLHLHIHCLITGGGLTADNQWRKPKRDTLLPYTAVMVKFRGKLLDRLDRAIEQEKITLPSGMSKQKWKNLKNKLGRKIPWNVNFRERYSHGKGVVMYLARYLRGGPISNGRILSCTEQEVTFKYRDKDKAKKTAIKTLPLKKFIRRYLLHVPMPRSKAVRSYGLYYPGKRKELDQARSLLGQPPIQEADFLTWQEFFEKQQEREEQPQRCPVCDKQLVCLEEIPPDRPQTPVRKIVRAPKNIFPLSRLPIPCAAGVF